MCFCKFAKNSIMYCNKCGQNKEVGDFYISKGVVSKPCKVCRRKKALERLDKIGRDQLNKERRKNYISKKGRKKRVLLPDWVKRLSASISKRPKASLGTKITSKNIMLMYARQQGKCFYTGVDMVIGDFLRKPSVDRVNSKKGYTTANTVLCCHSINLAKNSSGYEEFKVFLEEIKG